MSRKKAMTREEAIAKLVAYAFWASEHVPDDVAQALDMAIEVLKERPHGEWEQVGEMTYKCTKCGWLKKTGLMPFCENCGARMKEGEAE